MTLPSNWNEWERETFEDLTEGFSPMMDNRYLQDLYHDALWDLDIPREERDRAYEELVTFMREEYDVEFADDFDWEEYREWYSQQ